MHQVIKQTDEEKTKMYMKVSKKKLIEMLIQCNKIIENYSRQINNSFISAQLNKD